MAEVSPEFQKLYEGVLGGMMQMYAEEVNRQRGMLDTITVMCVNKLVNIDPEQSVALAKSLTGDTVAEKQQAMKGAQTTQPETGRPQND